MLCVGIQLWTFVLSLKVPPKCFSGAEVWNGPLQQLDSFLFQLCLGSSSCCTTQLEPSFNCQTDGRTFDRWSTLHAPLSDWKVPRSPSLHHCASQFVVIFKSGPLHAARRLHFGIVCLKDIVLSVLLFILQLCKPKLCYHTDFRQKRLRLATLPTTRMISSLFSNCTDMKCIIWDATQATYIALSQGCIKVFFVLFCTL